MVVGKVTVLNEHVKERKKMKLLSHVQLFEIPWTAAYQVPPSMRFFQARVLEWVAIAFSDVMKGKG